MAQTIKPDEVPANSTPTEVETPDESKGASNKVSTVWPATSFRVESVPEITREGTMLTTAQLKLAEEKAAASGVKLVVENKEGGSK